MAIKTIQPLGNKIIVEPLPKKEEKTDGGIVVAETVNANLTEGKVVKVSDPIKERIAEGDIVLFSSGSGAGQFLNGKHLVWLQEHEIWGIVTKEN